MSRINDQLVPSDRDLIRAYFDLLCRRLGLLSRFHWNEIGSRAPNFSLVYQPIRGKNTAFRTAMTFDIRRIPRLYPLVLKVSWNHY
jgi:hypothetical protein